MPSGPVELWELRQPKPYTVHVQLLDRSVVIDDDVRRIGFREATFTDHGFSLSGGIVKLRHFLDACDEFGPLVLANPRLAGRPRLVRLRLHHP